jgi:hypothetical protein
VVAVEYGTALSFIYLIPNLGAPTLHELFLFSWAVAMGGAVAIYRYLPNSKQLAFEFAN